MSFKNAFSLEKKIRELIYKIFKEENMLVRPWRLGTVDSVISTTRLSVFVDGSATAITVPCNPDVPFAVSDEVWIIYINNNPLDKFAISKRAI